MPFLRRPSLSMLACALAGQAAHATVQIQQSTTIQSAHPSAAAIADFNKDGLPDLAVASRSDNAVRIFYGKPGGGFSEPISLSTGPRSGPDRLLAIDLSGHGDTGLAVVLHDAGRVQCFKNDGHGNLTAGNALAVGADPSAMIAASLDGTGAPTVLVCDRATGNLVLLRPSGNGLAAVGSIPTSFARPSGLVAADFTRDGIVDLALISAGGSAVTVLKGEGRSRFTAGPTLPLPPETHATSIAAGDVDGDGGPDLVVTLDTAANNIALYARPTDPLAAPKILRSGGGKPTDSAVADVDGDGRPDIVVANSSTGTLTILRSTFGGASALEAPSVFQLGDNPGHFALSRLGDRQPMVIAAPGGNAVTVLLPVQTPPCLADFDRSGTTTPGDIFAFINAWFAHDPRADVDGTSGFGIQDVFTFLHAWFVGCS